MLACLKKAWAPIAVSAVLMALLPAVAQAQVIVPHAAQVIVPEPEVPEPEVPEPVISEPATSVPASPSPAQQFEPEPWPGTQPSSTPPPALPPPALPTSSLYGPWDPSCHASCLAKWSQYYDQWDELLTRIQPFDGVTWHLVRVEKDSVDQAIKQEEEDAKARAQRQVEPEPEREYTEVSDEVTGPCPSFNPLRIADWITGDGGSAGCF